MAKTLPCGKRWCRMWWSSKDRSKNLTRRKTCFDDNQRVDIHRSNSTLHHPNASDRESLLQHGQGDDYCLIVGEVAGNVRKEILLIETHTDSTTIQYEGEIVRPNNIPHQHLHPSVVWNLLPNFEEEVKALALLSSLPTSWEVFCTTFANNCPKLNLDKTIGQVLTEDIRRKSMGLTIDDSTEAHNSTELIDWSSEPRKQAERTRRNSSRPRNREDPQRSKLRSSRSSAFCSHCRKSSHNVSDCWSMKRKENGRRLEWNTRRSDSNPSLEGNQINVANSRWGEILSLEDSMIGEVHFSVQDAQT